MSLLISDLYLRSAKDLHSSFQLGSKTSLERVKRVFPKSEAPSLGNWFTHSKALHVIAVESGSDNWRDLKNHCETHLPQTCENESEFITHASKWADELSMALNYPGSKNYYGCGIALDLTCFVLDMIPHGTAAEKPLLAAAWSTATAFSMYPSSPLWLDLIVFGLVRSNSASNKIVSELRKNLIYSHRECPSDEWYDEMQLVDDYIRSIIQNCIDENYKGAEERLSKLRLHVSDSLVSN